MRGLCLNHELHSYAYDERPVPGVSEVIGGLGLVETGYFTEWGRERGKAVHLAIEHYLCGDGLDWSSVDERIKGYVDAAVSFLSDAKIVAGPGTFVEIPIWHPLLGYAGMPDLVCEAFGDLCVPDFKSGGLGVAGIQTALYELAARIAYPTQGDKPRRRMAIQLFETGRYKKVDLQDGFDYPRARAAVDLYRTYIFKRSKGANRAAA